MTKLPKLEKKWENLTEEEQWAYLAFIEQESKKDMHSPLKVA